MHVVHLNLQIKSLYSHVHVHICISSIKHHLYLGQAASARTGVKLADCRSTQNQIHTHARKQLSTNTCRYLTREPMLLCTPYVYDTTATSPTLADNKTLLKTGEATVSLELTINV